MHYWWKKTYIVKKMEDMKRILEESKQGADLYRSYFDKEDKLENVNMRIAELTADKNAELINNHFSMSNSEEGGFSIQFEKENLPEGWRHSCNYEGSTWQYSEQQTKFVNIV